ncbi:MAG: PIG-L family deacetylase [Nitrososphaeria archaeon]
MNTNTNLSKKVLAIEAHPDDAEFLMAGTLTLLHQKGYNVHIASVCTGSGGSKTLNPREIASIRFNEATQSAQILDGSFETLGVPDGELVFENKIRAKVRELVRRVNPDIVITMSPNDYMPDHEITSYLTFDACFAKALQIHLYYADPIELTDKFGQKVFPEFCVDISSVIDIKEKMLSQHASQS